MNKKIALVTGANRGIGLEVVKQLVELDFIVFAGSRNTTKVQATTDNIIPIFLDVTAEESILKARDIIHEKFGLLDVLVNNAGIFCDDDSDILNVDLKTIQKTFETNTFGPIRIIQAMVPLLLKSKSARIVNVSSGLGSLSSIGTTHPSYNLSKLSLNAVTKMFAEMLRSQNILVNSVCPGWTNTDMGKGGRPVLEGAKSVVWAVTIKDDGPTGGFFRDGKKLEW